MRNLSAKLYRPKMAGANGTAWLVCDDYALTAFHCILDDNGKPYENGAVFRLEFAPGTQVEAVIADHSKKVDAVLLHILDYPFDTAGKIQFETLPSDDIWQAQDQDEKYWTGWGFPQGRPEGLQISGRIESPDAPYDNGSTAIQLTCDQAGAVGKPLNGMSGAAVLRGKKVVGLISSGPEKLDQRVIYATPMQQIAKAMPTMAKIMAEHNRSEAKRIDNAYLVPAEVFHRPPTPDHPGTKGIIRRANLVFKTGRLYGRDKEIIEITRAFDQGAHLVTLWGDNGCGKTRLAAEVGVHYLPHVDHIYMADLLACDGAESMRTEIANTIGVKDAHDELLAETLAVLIGEHRVMLILDSSQQLQHVRELIEHLLENCPFLYILAVRELPLAWEGRSEVARRVPPLALGNPLNGAPAGDADKSPARRLFIERARLANPDFLLTESNAGFIAGLCESSGGVPLAIEIIAGLAAPLFSKGHSNPVDVFRDVMELIGHLGKLAPLDPNGRLDAIIALACSQLNRDTNSLLCRLSVFIGGCTLDAVEVIGADLETARDPLARQLERLVAIGLLGSARGIHGKPYYRLQPAVLAYCRKKLADSGERDHTVRTQVGYYEQLASRAERRQTLLSSAELVEWFELLEFEYANLRNVLAWTAAHPDDPEAINAGLGIVGNLFWFWNLRGSLMDCLGWSETLLGMSATPTRNRGAALYCNGGLHFLRGNFVEAREQLTQSIAVWEHFADRRREGFSLVILGMVDLHQNKVPDALRHQRRAVELFRALDDRFGLALALNDQANIMLETDPRLAEESYLKSLALWKELRNNWGLGLTNSNLGRLACRVGDYPVAEERLLEALSIQSQNRYQWGHAESLKVMGYAMLGAGKLGAAAREFRDSFLAHQRLGRKQLVADCLDGLAKVAVELKRPLVAAYLVGTAIGIRHRGGHTLPPYLLAERDGCVAHARADADDDVKFDHELQAGIDAPFALVSQRAVACANEMIIQGTTA